MKKMCEAHLWIAECNLFDYDGQFFVEARISWSHSSQIWLGQQMGFVAFSPARKNRGHRGLGCMIPARHASDTKPTSFLVGYAETFLFFRGRSEKTQEEFQLCSAI